MKSLVQLRLTKGNGRLLLFILLFIINEQAMIYPQTKQIKWELMFAYYMVDIPYFLWVAWHLMPFTFSRKNLWVAFPLACMGGLAVYVLAQNIMDVWVLAIKSKAPLLSHVQFSYVKSIGRWSHLTLFGIAYYVGWEGAKSKLLAQELALQNQRLRQLGMRAAIKPHFVSNTLAFIINRLALQSPIEADYLRQFEKMISYGISQQVMVSLQQELAQVKRCITLSSITLGQPLQMEILLDTDNAANKLQLPPLILANLVENMFTHGKLDVVGRPAQLHIKVVGKQLMFYCSNSKKKARKLGSKGIGMNYLHTLLQQYYEDRHQLEIREDQDDYELHLNIQL